MKNIILKYPLHKYGTYIVLFLSLSCAYTAMGQPLVTIEATDNITMDIPADFSPMTDDEIANRYITNRRPVAMYDDPSGNVNLGINLSPTRWDAKDMPILKDFYKSNIQNLYTEVEFSKEALEEINGRQYAVFEFESVVKDEEGSINQRPAIRNYTYIQYTIVNENLWVFNLSTPINLKNQWQAKAPQIMQSVKIKK